MITKAGSPVGCLHRCRPESMDLNRISRHVVDDGAGRQDFGSVAIIVAACHMATVAVVSTSCQLANAKQSQLRFDICLNRWVRQALRSRVLSQFIGDLFIPLLYCFCLAFAYETMSAPSACTRR